MRAAHLSRAIAAPARGGVAEDARGRVRQRLVTEVGGLVERLPEGEGLEITMPVLRRALDHPELLLGPGEPFAWQPKFVRRSLGLAVVRACAEGRFRSPAEAVGPVASEVVDEWALTGWKAFYWEPWFASLGAGARAMVLAEAVGWATALWTALDWSLLGRGLRLGGTDDRWVLPVARPVRLKSRCEVRVATAAVSAEPACDGPDWTGPPSYVSVSGGSPSPSWSEELGFLALAALRSPSVPLPARVTGLWPEAGTSRVVEIDEAALTRAVDRLLEAVATQVDARMSGLASQ